MSDQLLCVQKVTREGDVPSLTPQPSLRLHYNPSSVPEYPFSAYISVLELTNSPILLRGQEFLPLHGQYTLSLLCFLSLAKLAGKVFES
jgi:hypothetical protein